MLIHHSTKKYLEHISNKFADFIDILCCVRSVARPVLSFKVFAEARFEFHVEGELTWPDEPKLNSLHIVLCVPSTPLAGQIQSVNSQGNTQ